jgi:hypothetical protein
MDINFVNFVTDFKTYTKAGDIFKDENVLGYHIVNTGNCVAFINNFPLWPSGVLDTMLIGYKDKSKYSIRFDNIAAVNPEITVITFNKS